MAAKDKALESEEQVRAKIMQAPSFQKMGGREASNTHTFMVTKKNFKVGSIDTLMQLNETTSKIDTRLENVCRKIETLARANPNAQGAALKITN